MASEHSMLRPAVAFVTTKMTQQDEHKRHYNMYMQYTHTHTHTNTHSCWFFITLNTYDYVFIALVSFLVCKVHSVVASRERGGGGKNANLYSYHALQSCKPALQSTSPVTHSWP